MEICSKKRKEISVWWLLHRLSLVKWLPMWRSAPADSLGKLWTWTWRNKLFNICIAKHTSSTQLYPDLSLQVMAQQEIPSSLALMGNGAVAQLFLYIFLAMATLKGFIEVPQLKWGFQNQFLNDKLKIVYSASFSALPELNRSPLCPAKWWDKQIPPHQFLIPSPSLVGSLVSSFLCLSY